MVSDVSESHMEHEGVCKGFALGNDVKNPFPSSESKSKEILDLFHSDVCGPMPVKSFGGSLYYVTFINDFSRKMWIYFMKTKGEVFNKFQEFKAEVENLIGKTIMILRSDNAMSLPNYFPYSEKNNFCQFFHFWLNAILVKKLRKNGGSVCILVPCGDNSHTNNTHHLKAVQFS